jgi:hypothetical protein
VPEKAVVLVDDKWKVDTAVEVVAGAAYLGA